MKRLRQNDICTKNDVNASLLAGGGYQSNSKGMAYRKYFYSMRYT